MPISPVPQTPGLILDRPKAVGSGGLLHGPHGNSLRYVPNAGVRQPDLHQAPRIGGIGASQIGAGGGVYIRNRGSDADCSQGELVWRMGLNPGVTFAAELNFFGTTFTPVLGQFTFLLDWARFSGQNVVGTRYLFAFDATGFPPLLSNHEYRAQYQWVVSQ